MTLQTSELKSNMPSSLGCRGPSQLWGSGSLRVLQCFRCWRKRTSRRRERHTTHKNRGISYLTLKNIAITIPLTASPISSSTSHIFPTRKATSSAFFLHHPLFSAFRNPHAQASCVGLLTVYARTKCAAITGLINLSAPITKPTRQPVALKSLPIDTAVRVSEAISGDMVATRVCEMS